MKRDIKASVGTLNSRHVNRAGFMVWFVQLISGPSEFSTFDGSALCVCISPQRNFRVQRSPSTVLPDPSPRQDFFANWRGSRHWYQIRVQVL